MVPEAVLVMEHAIEVEIQHIAPFAFHLITCIDGTKAQHGPAGVAAPRAASSSTFELRSFMNAIRLRKIVSCLRMLLVHVP